MQGGESIKKLPSRLGGTGDCRERVDSGLSGRRVRTPGHSRYSDQYVSSTEPRVTVVPLVRTTMDSGSQCVGKGVVRVGTSVTEGGGRHWYLWCVKSRVTGGGVSGGGVEDRQGWD